MAELQAMSEAGQARKEARLAELAKVEYPNTNTEVSQNIAISA